MGKNIKEIVEATAVRLSIVEAPLLRRSTTLTAAALAFFLTSCEKEIIVSLPDAQNKIVVEGVIEQGKHPYVILTRNASYFAPIGDFTENLFVQNAVVVVSNGTMSDTLEPTLDTEIMNPLPILAYKSSGITGEVGKTYSLTIIAEGTTLTATTTITPPIALDSLWFRPKPGADNDSLGNMWAHLTDPDTIGNNYRWFTKVLGRDPRYLAPEGSVFNDKFVNGESFDFYYNHPDDPLVNSDTIDHNHRFEIGETVAVKFCTIDVPAFQFLLSADNVINSGENPFAAPSSVFTNITGGGLGSWIGYGVFYDTLVIK